jgi:hypothetical protein
MPLWMLIVILATLVKLPIAGLLLWVPFRDDEAMRVPDAGEPSDEEGGSKVLPGDPGDPHPPRLGPRAPRRGPHGVPPAPAPRRVRTAAPRLGRQIELPRR